MGYGDSVHTRCVGWLWGVQSIGLHKSHSLGKWYSSWGSIRYRTCELEPMNTVKLDDTHIYSLFSRSLPLLSTHLLHLILGVRDMHSSDVFSVSRSPLQFMLPRSASRPLLRSLHSWAYSSKNTMPLRAHMAVPDTHGYLHVVYLDHLKCAKAYVEPVRIYRHLGRQYRDVKLLLGATAPWKWQQNKFCRLYRDKINLDAFWEGWRYRVLDGSIPGNLQTREWLVRY